MYVYVYVYSNLFSLLCMGMDMPKYIAYFSFEEQKKERKKESSRGLVSVYTGNLQGIREWDC